ANVKTDSNSSFGIITLNLVYARLVLNAGELLQRNLSSVGSSYIKTFDIFNASSVLLIETNYQIESPFFFINHSSRFACKTTSQYLVYFFNAETKHCQFVSIEANNNLRKTTYRLDVNIFCSVHC